MKYLIDSDYVVDYLKGRSVAITLLDTLVPEGLAISIITYAEVYEGIYYGQTPQEYKRIFRRFLTGVQVLGISRLVAEQFAIVHGQLRKQGLLIPHPDLFIAVTAVQHNLTVVTRNIRHFERVPNLKLYQPS